MCCGSPRRFVEPLASQLAMTYRESITEMRDIVMRAGEEKRGAACWMGTVSRWRCVITVFVSVVPRPGGGL